MARRFNMMVVVVMVALATLLHGSLAQTVHVVGGTVGWTIPSGGATTYTTWAATQTFRVGDILMFNFATGAHDVAKVTKAAFDSCNATSPISISNSGPANITIDAAGEHYFFCTFSGHCSLGQKLAINVSAASSSPAPAPQPAATTPTTPSPVSAPTPAPSRAPMTYEVGDSLGWTVPAGGAVVYQTWARNKTFLVGDTLVFNFTAGAHDVAEISKAAYDACNSTTTITHITTSPARITLSTAGQHYYLCTFPGHCSLGQKLAINVTGTGTATPPSSTATPPSTSTTPPSSTATPPSTSTTPTTPSSPSPAGTPGNSATSFATAGFFTTFLSIAVALLY